MYRSRRGVVLLLTLVTLVGVLVIAVPSGLSFARSRGHTRAHTGTSAASSLPPASGSATVRSCSSWQILSSPNLGVVDNILTGVAAVAPNDAWAVGSASSGGAGQTLIEHWDGSHWSLSPVSGNQGGLAALAALSSNDIWAVGAMLSPSNGTQTTLTLHWDGSTWSNVPSPNVPGVNSSLSAVAALAPNDVWAVGNTINSQFVESTLAMHWDGSAWTIVSTPNTSGVNNVLNGVAAVATNDVWAVGKVNGNTLTDHWNGSSWSVVASPNGSPNGAQLLGVTALASNDVWAVGGTFTIMGNPSTHALIEHWTGSAWQVVPSRDQLTENLLYGIAVVPGTHQLWVVGMTSKGTIGTGSSLIEQWNGTAWTLSTGADTLGGDATLYAVAADSGGVWAVGTNNANDNLTLIERHSRLQLGIACP